MKKKWTNNLGIKILSVAIAFLLWVVIINIEDPATSRTFRVQVEIQNDKVVETSGQVYKIVEGEYVDVTVKGTKSFVDSLTDSDITATADFRYLSNYGSVPITAKCTKYTTTKYTMELGSVDHVLVKLEAIKKSNFIVRFNVVGEPPSGYYVDTNLITSDPTKIMLSGGESIIKSIASVEVNIDASGQTSKFKEKLEPKIYDNAGNLIDSSNITCSVSEVSVEVTVLQTKKVPVNINLTGSPAQGYKAEEPVYDPTELMVAGTKEDLKKISSIDLTVALDNASKTIQRTIDLSEGMLPSSLYIVGDKSNVNIEVPIEKLESKEITFNTSDIAVKMPSGMSTYSFNDVEQEFKVKVYAVAGEIDKVTIDTLKPTIDLTEKSFGTYKVKIHFGDSYLVEPVGSIKVKVTLENPEESQTPEEKPTATPKPTATAAPSPTETPEEKPAATATPTPTESPVQTGRN